MAQIDTGGGGGKKGKKVRSKKMSTNIDFTPMVDLGFLLITFFMLTTTLSKPTIMPVVFPDKKDLKEDDLPPVKESKVLTLLLGKDDKVYYYEGITDPKLDSTDYSADGIRRIILDKKDRVNQEWGQEDVEVTNKQTGEKEPKKRSFINVILKPTKDSRYKNIVDAFDEMSICGISRYVLLDISEAEEKFLVNPAAGLKFDAAAQLEAAKSK